MITPPARTAEADESSASLITQTTGASRPRNSSLRLSMPLCIAAVGALAFGTGPGFWSSNPAATWPHAWQGTTGAGSPGAVFQGAQAHETEPSLLSLVGSWAGDDFEECLQLVYETRSAVVEPDVSS